MKKRAITITTFLLFSILTPLALVNAGHDMNAMEKGDNKTIMLENNHQDGVMAMVHLYDVRAAMAQHGMKETHHMMVMFTSMQDNKANFESRKRVEG